MFNRLHKHSILFVGDWVFANVKLRDVNLVLWLLLLSSVFVFLRVAAHEKFTGRDAYKFQVNWLRNKGWYKTQSFSNSLREGRDGR